MRRHFFSFILVFLLLGCAVTPEPISTTKVAKLASLLRFDSVIPHTERLHLARAIYFKTKVLTEEFELTSPPLWHNMLVNVGIKQKGLCYHWSDALYMYLNKKRYPHYDFYLVGDHIGEYFSEHNALVVTEKGARVEDGIVIDAWRNSGDLYVSKVKEDTEYQWLKRKVSFK